jgi:hypothetical protein
MLYLAQTHFYKNKQITSLINKIIKSSTAHDKI